MLQSQGLRAGSGGSEYVPPAPGEYDATIGGYFAGHMQGFSEQSLFGGGEPESVYQMWLAPKSMESDITNSTYITNLSAYSYNQYSRNDQVNGYRNDLSGKAFFPVSENNWYTPAIMELHQMFRYLRPSNNRYVWEGYTGSLTYINPYYWYDNHYAIPAWDPYTGASTWPADLSSPGTRAPEPYMVDNTLFQAGGAQAFEQYGWYMSSTIIDQVSQEIYADQLGRAIITFRDPNPAGAGLIENPIYYKTVDAVNANGFDISKYALDGLGGFPVYSRPIKRRTIAVTRDYLDDYYGTKRESNGHYGRFRRTLTNIY